MSSIMRGRNVINILLLSLIFIIIFFIFIVLIFLPAGKNYKKEYKVYTKQMHELDIAQEQHDRTMELLKELQAKNRSIILGYENTFETQIFHKQYGHFFKNLKLSKIEPKGRSDIFDIFEVTTNALLTSPADLYEFMEQINKGNNIIHVQFPIKFIANEGQVSATFLMQIQTADYEKFLKLRDANVSAEKVGAKF